MFVLGSLLNLSTTLLGLLLGGIALGGFIGHVPSVFRGASESEVREATVRGGLFGIGGASFVIFLSALIG